MGSRLPAAERREQLLDVAAELFSRNGYARATTAQLARAAGVTEPIIYRHFSSKRDLFVALIERTGERTLNAWREHLADATDPADRLRRLINDNPMVTAAGRDSYRVFLQSLSESDDEAIREAVHEHIDKLREFLEEELEAAQRARRVPQRFSADVLARVMLCMGLGYGVLSAMGIAHPGRAADGQHVSEVLARALVGRAGEEGNSKKAGP